jgi:hypothetical protein
MTHAAKIFDSTVCFAGRLVPRRLIAGHQSEKNARFVPRHPDTGPRKREHGSGGAMLHCTKCSHTLYPRTLAG